MKANSLVHFIFIGLVQKWLSKLKLISCQARIADAQLAPTGSETFRPWHLLLHGRGGCRPSAVPKPSRHAQLRLITWIRNSKWHFLPLSLLISTTNYHRTEGEFWSSTDLMRCHLMVFTLLFVTVWEISCFSLGLYSVCPLRLSGLCEVRWVEMMSRSQVMAIVWLEAR